MSIVVNNWRMDSSLNALIHCETGETRRLGEYHFILLETLAKNADVVLSRSFLMTAVWKNRIVGGNSLPTAVHALRVAIDDDGKQQEIIKTIPKKGICLIKTTCPKILTTILMWLMASPVMKPKRVLFYLQTACLKKARAQIRECRKTIHTFIKQ